MSPSPAVFLTTVCIMFGTILLVFGMRYASLAFQARARLANDDAYRTLAERAVAAQSQNQASLSAIDSELARLAASLGAVEKILKQVE